MSLNCLNKLELYVLLLHDDCAAFRMTDICNNRALSFSAEYDCTKKKTNNKKIYDVIMLVRAARSVRSRSLYGF